MPETTTTPATLSVKDAAEFVGVSVFSLYKDIAVGRMLPVEQGGPVLRRGRSIRLNTKRLAEWVDGGAR